MVWISRLAKRDRPASTECPRSWVTGESAAWVERFTGEKGGAMQPLEERPVREAEALLLLRNEWTALGGQEDA